MTNLEYLEKFITETYGAICFHNDPEDGYAELSGNKKIETLAIYFANQIDLSVPQTAERLTKAAGEKFYERYVGARGMKLCALNSCIILTRCEQNGKTCAILHHIPTILGGGVMDIINYFAGGDIRHRTLERPNNVNMPMPTNNDFALDTGDNIQEAVEGYLLKKKLPAVTEENGFFVKGEKFDYKAEGFWEHITRVQEIQDARHAEFLKASRSLTSEDIKLYRAQLGQDENDDYSRDGDDADEMPETKTNLQAAQLFFTEVFGAVCFYNDPEDGYVELSGNRKIETLSVKSAGGEGDFTLAAYHVGDKTIGIVPYGAAGVDNDILSIARYFCGININGYSREKRYFSKNLQTQCGFVIKKGMPLMDTVDKFLIKNRIIPLRAGFNFMLQKDSGAAFKNAVSETNKLFKAEADKIRAIAEVQV